MTKERVKNVLLVFLVIMDFVLGSRILIEKKLWPDGYNFFSNMNDLDLEIIYTSIKGHFTDNDKYKSKVFAPERMVINTGDQTTRISLDSSDDEFESIYEEASAVLKSALMTDSENTSVIKKEELYSALTSSSLYLAYPRNSSTDLFAQVLGTQNNAIDDGDMMFSDVVIVPKARSEVYISNRDSDSCYKVNVFGAFDSLVNSMSEYVEKHSMEKSEIINYSFDLKFDKPFGTQKTTLNPLIQIYSSVPEYPVINSKNPINQGSNINEDIVDDILRVFNINANTMRRYTEAGGTVVFVENNAILKIDQNGYLEYSATDGGLEISSTNTEYSKIITLASMASRINEAGGNNCDIRIAESEDGTKNKINFDYIIHGIPVKINFRKAGACVETVVEDGILKSYKQLIRKYEISDAMTSLTEFFTALDNVIVNYSEFMNEINIEKMYFGYSDDGTVGGKTADWIVKVDNVIADE